MYNPDFLPQLKTFEQDLFGNRGQPSAIDSARYCPPVGIRIIECHEDVNGEWVPKSVHTAESPLKEKANSV